MWWLTSCSFVGSSICSALSGVEVVATASELNLHSSEVVVGAAHGMLTKGIGESLHLPNYVEQTKFEQTDLEQTKLEQAKLAQTKLEQAKLAQTKLELTKLEQTKSEETKLEQTKLELTKLEQTKLEQTKLEQTKLKQTKLEQTKLEQTKLERHLRHLGQAAGRTQPRPEAAECGAWLV